MPKGWAVAGCVACEEFLRAQWRTLEEASLEERKPMKVILQEEQDEISQLLPESMQERGFLLSLQACFSYVQGRIKEGVEAKAALEEWISGLSGRLQKDPA